jgi:hypothetical protein
MAWDSCCRGYCISSRCTCIERLLYRVAKDALVSCCVYWLSCRLLTSAASCQQLQACRSFR